MMVNTGLKLVTLADYFCGGTVCIRSGLKELGGCAEKSHWDWCAGESHRQKKTLRACFLRKIR